MATRRPASSRAKINYNANSNPQPSAQPPRARSVMAKRHGEDIPQSDAPIAGSRSLKASLHQEEHETNIRVIVRCRRRSGREVEDNSPIIVRLNGAKSKEVLIETSTPTSTLGMLSLPSERTYPFDLVFGPEADQALIYHEVVSPMLEEVLLGYNCTLFAYGQTGTGKTFTMQGDLTPTPLGNPSPSAGMIPRVLFRLFHQLDSSGADYSVKISFIELYNEELRDLLANELSPPAGSSQPMALGAKDNKPAESGLKIFDDSSKRGVFIQGLEEIPVKDSKDALELLTKGSHRRQIAATKFNDHSSRSHSVFSITVHTKETSAMGDDLLRIGKLNLVDLAGSENIGRSGAENKRAREAGMINQSLLTLGRVINALVDRAQHVPYRESKLTRLLQDSLGGRTKTCIIATISPARSNMEETLSTLDYALRAKSIRNKPELNQRMTRNSLLKEYVAEIERLKADLLAAREKNGIFFSEETWNQMVIEQELRQTEIEEGKKQTEIVENQLKNLREEFDQSIALLRKREGDLRDTREELHVTQGALEGKVKELRTVQVALEEEEVVRKAYQTTEVALDGVAQGLRTVVHQGLDDIDGLFQKLERQAKVLNSNSNVASIQGEKVATSTAALSRHLEEFIRSLSKSFSNALVEAHKVETTQLPTLDAHAQKIAEQLKIVVQTFSQITSLDEEASTVLAKAENTVKDVQKTFVDGYLTWVGSLKSSIQLISQKLAEHETGGYTNAEKALEVMWALISTISTEEYTFHQQQQKDLDCLRSLASSATHTEIAYLKQQNEQLTRLLEEEKTKSLQAKSELIQRISGLLGDFVVERDKSLRTAIGTAVDEHKKAQQRIGQFADRHAESITTIDSRNIEALQVLDRHAKEGKGARDGALKALGTSRTAFTHNLENIGSTISSSSQSYSKRLRENANSMVLSCSDAFDQHSRAKRARIEVSNSLSNEVQTGYHDLQQGIISVRRNIHTHTSHMSNEIARLSALSESHRSTANGHLALTQHAANTLLEDGVQEDVSAGTTPRKRSWKYIDTWEITKDRQYLLESWKNTTFVPGIEAPPINAESPARSPNASPPPIDTDSGMSTDSPIQPSSLTSSASSSEQPPPLPLPSPPILPLKQHKRVTSKPGLCTTAVPPLDPRTINTARPSRRNR